MTTKIHPLDDVEHIFALVDEDTVLCVKAVAKAREAGYSWSQIGYSMGDYSRQGAQQWFMRHEHLLEPTTKAAS